MKILQVVHGFPPENVGGTELYVERLARSLAERGHEIVVVAGTLRYEDEDPRLEAFERDGLRGYWLLRADLYFDSWEKSYDARSARLFQELLRRERPDLVHVHHWVRLSRDLVHRAALEGIPAVVTLHDLWATCLICFRVKPDESFCNAPLAPENCLDCVQKHEWMGASEGERAVRLLRDDVRNELRLARRCIVPSRSHGEFVGAVTGVDPSSFTVVPHGAIDRLRAVEPLPGAAGVDRKLRVACWSHLHHLKGQHVLLEAVRRMRGREKIELHLLGDCWEEGYRARLDELARGLDVHFHGLFRHPELEALRPDLAVMPTLCHESYSFVVDEARAMRVPMLATRLGALIDRVPPGGELFERGDAGGLAGLLDRALGEDGLLERWRGAIVPPERFEDSPARLEEIYSEVLGERAAGAPDAFDPVQHEEFESYRSEQRYRYLLRYSDIKAHAEALERQLDALRARRAGGNEEGAG